jgi:hypothetical protein
MLAEPPSNGEYLVAAYVISTLILGGYWIRLWRLAKKSVSGKTDRVSGSGKNVSGKREGTR